ncbi:MAG TPA: methyltransferase domain-containing protein [Candidatus Kryptonia bacterium]
MKINIGCGSVKPAGWVNVDYSMGARLSRVPLYNLINRKLKLFDLDPHGNPWNWDGVLVRDLQKRFPWGDGEADVVYASHIVEHFSKKDGLRLLTECHRVLRTGGVIRIVVPDLKVLVEKYRTGKMRADDLVESLGVLYETRNNRLKDFFASFLQFPHKCMYDTSALVEVLNSIGFDAESKGPFESRIDDINAIELGERTLDAVIVEGVKR